MINLKIRRTRERDNDGDKGLCPELFSTRISLPPFGVHGRFVFARSGAAASDHNRQECINYADTAIILSREESRLSLADGMSIPGNVS